MMQQHEKERKIAANYIFLPGFPLTKNGYVILKESGLAEVVDTNGEIREMAGLEFYGGLIVPDYIQKYTDRFQVGMQMLPELEKLFGEYEHISFELAIIEGADLRSLLWQPTARVRVIR